MTGLLFVYKSSIILKSTNSSDTGRLTHTKLVPKGDASCRITVIRQQMLTIDEKKVSNKILWNWATNASFKNTDASLYKVRGSIEDEKSFPNVKEWVPRVEIVKS